MDSAHNLEGVSNFLSEFKKDIKRYSKKVVLFGAMRDKAVEEMLNMLKECFDEIHITAIKYERACSIKELKEIASNINLKIVVEDDPLELVSKFNNEDEKSVLVVLGSMYLLGEIKSRIVHK